MAKLYYILEFLPYDPATQGARALATVVLASFSCDIWSAALEGLINSWLPAWWALWLLWWPLADAAMFQCVYGYLQSVFFFLVLFHCCILLEIKLTTTTHWGRAMHICVGKLTTIGSDNGLSPGRRQAIIWTIAGILLFGPLGTNFSEILTGIQTFSFKKMHLKTSSAKWRPSCLGLNVLMLLHCLNFWDEIHELNEYVLCWKSISLWHL